MIFQFPSLEVLRIALSSGMVPAEVGGAAAEVSFDSQGRPIVKPLAPLSKETFNALERLGIASGQAHAAEPQTVASWHEIIPVVREPGMPEIAATTTVLFEFPAALLADLATEMLRLGNDRQSFRCLAHSGAIEPRVVLRVIGPPYYTLLRALDQLDADIAAFVERAPRVWIQIGHHHPLAGQLAVPSGKFLILRPPNRWAMIADGPFSDIYSILDFQLPCAANDYAEKQLEKRSVPLRLAPGNAAELPDLWVLSENAVECLDAFVRDADERLLARLSFAAEKSDRPTIVVRVRPMRLPPPVLELPGAVGYFSYRRLGNLFLPAGTCLQPTLRRETVRQLLAGDSEQIVWLSPSTVADGAFQPMSLPDASFLPMQNWVKYVIDHHQQELRNWMEASTFDFESFVCDGKVAENPQSRSPRKAKPAGPDRTKTDEAVDAPPTAPKAAKIQKPPRAADTADFATSETTVAPDQRKLKRAELEQRFLAIEGTLDAAERVSLWPRLAELNGALGDRADASICWLTGLWQRPDLPEQWLRAWLRIEDDDDASNLTGEAIARELAIAAPTSRDMRRLSARLLLANADQIGSSTVGQRLPDIRRHMEKHESSLGVRAIWLVWLHLSKVGGDVLGLARVRDRLIGRLLDRGLDPESDIPRFIRLSGLQDRGRMREIIESAQRIHAAARAWANLESPAETAVTGAYIDLMFAFGFASLGENQASRDLLASAHSVLSRARDGAGDKDEAHQLLVEGFRYRIEQAMAGKPHRGPLPSDWRESLNDFKKRVGGDPRTTGPYIVERFQEQSWILEPEEKLNPCRTSSQNVGEWNREIAAINELKDTGQLSARISRLIFDRRNSKITPEMRAELAVDLLPFCPRAGADFTRQALEQVVPLIEQTTRTDGQPLGDSVQLPRIHGRLLERALLLAVNYDMPELVKRFTEQIERMFAIKDDESLLKFINLTATRCIRSLRRLGLRDEMQRLLIRMDAVLKDRISKTKLSMAVMKNRAAVYALRLQSAGAWFYFGDPDKPLATINEAGEFLFGNSPAAARGREPWHQDYAELAMAYAGAVGKAPIDFALDRIEEMFRRLAGVANGFSTRTHYSRLHLNVVEEVILSVMQTDATLGETARHWLEDDEYLVRRRIHADMRSLLHESGLS
jgi:cellulose synthase operon protein C